MRFDFDCDERVQSPNAMTRGGTSLAAAPPRVFLLTPADEHVKLHAASARRFPYDDLSKSRAAGAQDGATDPRDIHGRLLDQLKGMSIADLLACVRVLSVDDLRKLDAVGHRLPDPVVDEIESRLFPMTYADMPSPAAATDALASSALVEVYAGRHARGEHLYHPNDLVRVCRRDHPRLGHVQHRGRNGRDATGELRGCDYDADAADECAVDYSHTAERIADRRARARGQLRGDVDARGTSDPGDAGSHN